MKETERSAAKIASSRFANDKLIPCPLCFTKNNFRCNKKFFKIKVIGYLLQLLPIRMASKQRRKFYFVNF